jgi:hypothetical protein
MGSLRVGYGAGTAARCALGQHCTRSGNPTKSRHRNRTELQAEPKQCRELLEEQHEAVSRAFTPFLL